MYLSVCSCNVCQYNIAVAIELEGYRNYHIRPSHLSEKESALNVSVAGVQPPFLFWVRGAKMICC